MTAITLDNILDALADAVAKRMLADDGPLVTKMRDVFIDGLAQHDVVMKDDLDASIRTAIEDHESDKFHHEDEEEFDRAVHENVEEAVKDVLREMIRAV